MIMAFQNPLEGYDFYEKIKALPYVDRIYMYGSRARGDNIDDRSDVDLAIECPRASDEEWAKIKWIINKKEILLKLDCVRLDTLEDSLFKQEIEKDKKVIYEKK
jgi:uncharacterized protein